MPGSAYVSREGRTSHICQQPIRHWPVSTYIVKRDGVPELVGCNTVAVDIIPTIRPVVYEHPCLFTRRAKLEQGPKNTKVTGRERERRATERALVRELSRYYKLGKDQNKWGRPQLLEKGKHGLGHSMWDWQHFIRRCSSQCARTLNAHVILRGSALQDSSSNFDIGDLVYT
jgi:hypothetical protein